MDADSLRAELENTRMSLMSVQRNYETISRMMQVKQQELEQVCMWASAKIAGFEGKTPSDLMRLSNPSDVHSLKGMRSRGLCWGMDECTAACVI